MTRAASVTISGHLAGVLEEHPLFQRRQRVGDHRVRAFRRALLEHQRERQANVFPGREHGVHTVALPKTEIGNRRRVPERACHQLNRGVPRLVHACVVDDVGIEHGRNLEYVEPRLAPRGDPGFLCLPEATGGENQRFHARIRGFGILHDSPLERSFLGQRVGSVGKLPALALLARC